MSAVGTPWPGLGKALGTGRQRLRVFVARTGPLGADGLLALGATVATVLLTLAARHGDVPSYLSPYGSLTVPGLRSVTPQRPGSHPVASWSWAQLVLALRTAWVTLPLAWRRTMPLLVLGTQIVGMLVVPQAMNLATFLALLICAYTVSVHYRHGIMPVVALSAATAVTAHTFSGLLPTIPSELTPVAIMLPVWLAGRSIRNWRARAAMFQEQALRAEREREAALRLAVAEERARIARELHDVVSHHVSVMVIQSGAAGSVLRSDPDAAARALQASEVSGREAMVELRHLLGVLSPTEDDAPLAPQPGLDQLDALIDRVTAAGLPVSVRIVGEARTLPPGVDLAAYRVVQEALTNALKYAVGARGEVIVTFGSDDLTVEVLDDGVAAQDASAGGEDPPGTGRGLLGLAERLGLYGGELHAGRRLAGGYRVHARIPVNVR